MPSGKLTILTGAASGIGRAAAEALAKRSHRLALVDRDVAMLKEVEAACRRSSAQSAAFECDVSDDAAVAKACRNIHEQMGTVSVLINCAGVGKNAPFLETTDDDWVRMFKVNIMGAVHFTRAVLPG